MNGSRQRPPFEKVPRQASLPHSGRCRSSKKHCNKRQPRASVPSKSWNESARLPRTRTRTASAPPSALAPAVQHSSCSLNCRPARLKRRRCATRLPQSPHCATPQRRQLWRPPAGRPKLKIIDGRWRCYVPSARRTVQWTNCTKSWHWPKHGWTLSAGWEWSLCPSQSCVALKLSRRPACTASRPPRHAAWEQKHCLAHPWCQQPQSRCAVPARNGVRR
mmetsp:Transcript_25386/g.58495  ORF Transcript_25386/g.58495 Transcript_25386/m.58495 type:complete len:219 (-) Transcript_25386:162-818(-)